MATTKYKYDKVCNARHIMRDTLGSVGSMTKPGLWETGAGDDMGAVALARDIRTDVSEAQSNLRGERGLSRETQVQRLSDAREKVAAAIKLATKLAKVAATPAQENLAADIKAQLILAKEHGTSAISYAKNRRFESSKAEYEALHVVAEAKESMDNELEALMEDSDF